MKEKVSLELIIKKCSVCQKIQIGGLWYDSKYIEIMPKHKFSHGICSVSCCVEGYGLRENEAKEIFKEVLKYE